MIIESFGAKIAAGALASTAVVGGGYAVSTQQCPAGQESTIFGCATVTHYDPNTKVYPNPGQGKPKKGTGGLIIRDDEGVDTGSGIGENQLFDILECGPKGSGLVLVVQTTRGHGGGWGMDYAGYVKWKYVDTNSKKVDCKF